MGIGGAAGGAQVQTATTPKTRLYVKTLPPGAQVTLDGQPLGVSDGLFLVPAGTGKVSVQFDGAEPQVRQVEIAEGRITRVEVSFAGNQPAGAGGDVAAAAARAQAVPRRRLTSKREPVKPKPLTAIDGVLNKPLEQPLEFVETPLRDVIAGFRKAAGIDVIIDRRGLGDAGLDLDAPITSHVPAGLPLATALEMVVGETGLAWIVRDDLLEITTRERAQERLLVRVHDVADLAETADWLIIDLVQELVAPPTWEVVGGSGSIQPDSTALVISQSLQVQRQVAGFLDVLRRLKATPADDRRPLGVDGYWSALPAAVAARAALKKPVSVDFEETPLRHVMAQLAKEAGVPIRAERALEESVVDLDETTVTFTLEDKPLAVVLDRILEPLDLAWEVRDEGLVVTTKERSQQFDSMTVAVYPVGHLGGGDRSVNALADMMMSVVQFATWDSAGGPAVVKAVDGDVPCFVVRQSTAGHRAVHEFLESLPPSRQSGEFAPTLDSAQGMGAGGGMGFCWVAREVYGPHDPRWLVFRDWLIGDAPAWLLDLYGKHGESFAAWIRDKPAVKGVLRVLMDRAVSKSRHMFSVGLFSTVVLQVGTTRDEPPQPDLPDVIVSAIAVEGRNLVVELQNQGPGAAKTGTKVEAVMSRWQHYGDAAKPKGITVSVPVPVKPMAVERVMVPLARLGVKDSVSDVTITLDPKKELAESRPDNNCFDGPLFQSAYYALVNARGGAAKVAGDELPDLVITDVFADGHHVHCTCMNVGQGVTGADFTISWRSGEQSFPGNIYYRFKVPPPGQKVATGGLTLEAIGLRRGVEADVEVIVDPEDRVRESTKSNNTFRKRFVIAP